MNVYQWLCLLGVPSIVTALFAYIVGELKRSKKEYKALKSGLQALLRAQMIRDYNTYSEKGYAPLYARENFENCWQHYHSLGVNGVMDNIHEKFMELPTFPNEE